MNDKKQASTRGSWKKLAVAIPTLIVLLAAIPTDSKADGGHRGHGRHEHGYGYHHSTRAYSSPGWAVPRRIYVDNRSTYGPYFYGRSYYGPHRHYHATYQFPVYVGGSVVYRPYSYCGDHIFIGAAVPLPRLAFGVTFGAPISVYGPNPYPYGGAPSYQQGDRDDDGNDDYYDDENDH